MLLDSFFGREELDKWVRCPEENGDFTVNSLFLLLDERFVVNSGFCLLSWVCLGVGSRGLVLQCFCFSVLLRSPVFGCCFCSVCWCFSRVLRVWPALLSCSFC